MKKRGRIDFDSLPSLPIADFHRSLRVERAGVRAVGWEGLSTRTGKPHGDKILGREDGSKAGSVVSMASRARWRDKARSGGV